MTTSASAIAKPMPSGPGTTAFPLHETGPVYAVRVIKEVGADNLVYGSDYGQIHNMPHIVGTEWTIKLLLAYGATKKEVNYTIQASWVGGLSVAILIHLNPFRVNRVPLTDAKKDWKYDDRKLDN